MYLNNSENGRMINFDLYLHNVNIDSFDDVDFMLNVDFD